MSEADERSIFAKQFGEAYGKEPLDISGYSEVTLERSDEAQWQRPDWPLELYGLQGNGKIRDLVVRLPARVSLDLSHCEEITSVDLAECVLGSPLKLGPRQKYLSLLNCELPGLLQTRELISLELKSAVIGDAVVLPRNLERLSIDSCEVKFEGFPKSIEEFRFTDCDSSLAAPVLDFLSGGSIEIEGLCHIRGVRLSKSISLGTCDNLSISDCQLDPDFRLKGHFGLGYIQNGQQNYFAGHIGDGLYFEDLGASDWYNSDSILGLAMVSQNLTVGLDGDFPDLSASKLKSLTLSSWRNCNFKIPVEYLPDSLEMIRPSSTEYRIENRKWPDEFLRQYS